MELRFTIPKFEELAQLYLILTCCSAELSTAQRSVLRADVDEPPDHVVAAAGEGHERQAQGLLRGVQAAQGVGR